MNMPDNSASPKAASDTLRTLASVPLLADLTPQEFQALAERARLCTHPKGAQIFVENQQATGFHVLADGLVKICHFTTEGREMVLHLIRPGGTFGEAALFQGGTFPASAVAMRASRSLLLPGPFFMELVRGNPDLALRIIATLSLRLRMFTRKLESRHLREAPQRLAAYLLHRSRLDGGTPSVRLDTSREVLASMLGTARETLSRTLTRLVELGAVEVRGREVLLLDTILLQKVSDGDIDVV